MSFIQRQFFNTSLMTSARAMNAFKRAKQELPYKVQPTYQPAVKVGENMEFHLPDESREFDLKYLKRCPVCRMEDAEYYHGPIMERECYGSESTFAIRCANPKCNHRTPVCKSSKEAVNTWQVAAILMSSK